MSEQAQMLPASRDRATKRRRMQSGVLPESGDRDFPATLLAMAGHDLRQPLQIITSAHDVLAAALGDDDNREELARAADATSLLATMLGQIVDAVQLHEVARDCKSEALSLGPILEELAGEFCWPARAKDISLHIAPSHAAVFSHPILLRGMLRNLLRNALDYTPPGGRVAMTCRRSARGLRINVSDTGIGIRRDALVQIFNAFAREDTSRVDGLGLGLFIVKGAADLLRHRIEVRSIQGRGSCFTVIAEPAAFSDAIVRAGQRGARRPRPRRPWLWLGGPNPNPRPAAG